MDVMTCAWEVLGWLAFAGGVWWFCLAVYDLNERRAFQRHLDKWHAEFKAIGERSKKWK